MMNVTKTWKNTGKMNMQWLRHIYMRQTCSSCKTTDAENDAGFYVREA